MRATSCPSPCASLHSMMLLVQWFAQMLSCIIFRPLDKSSSCDDSPQVLQVPPVTQSTA